MLGACTIPAGFGVGCFDERHDRFRQNDFVVRGIFWAGANNGRFRGSAPFMVRQLFMYGKRGAVDAAARLSWVEGIFYKSSGTDRSRSV